MCPGSLPENLEAELTSAARTVVGDELRSLTYFTEADIEQLYLRSDLEPGADLTQFAETERLGYKAQMDYQGTELGEYQFTIRVFEYGYLTRVIVGDHGVFVTTDAMARDRFEELAAAVRGVFVDLIDE